MTSRSRGFTLIEVIATFVLFGIVAAMVMPYVSNAPNSTFSLLHLSQPAQLNAVMATMTADYENIGEKNNAALLALQGRIGPASPDNVDGALGAYKVTENAFVKIDAADALTPLALRVTIASPQGDTLTTLFTEKP